MERDRLLRAARDGSAVIALTVVAALFLGDRTDVKLLPADVTLTAPVGKGTEQLQFLIRGAGCDQRDTSPRGYKEPRKRVRPPVQQYTKDAITITYKVEDPGRFACRGFDPGVPKTLTLRLPVGDRRLLDGTKNPPTPFRTGPPRTLPLGAIPDESPSPPAQPRDTPSATSSPR